MKEQTMTSIDPDLKKKAKSLQINLSELLENAIRNLTEVKIDLPIPEKPKENSRTIEMRNLVYEFVGTFRQEILEAYHDMLNGKPFVKGRMFNMIHKDEQKIEGDYGIAQ